MKIINNMLLLTQLATSSMVKMETMKMEFPKKVIICILKLVKPAIIYGIFNICNKIFNEF